MNYKLAKLIRVLTIAPFMAAVTLTVLFTVRPEQIGGVFNYAMSLLFLAVLPVLSYPLQKIIPPLKRRGREGQRNLAIIMANLGYIAGIAFALAADTPRELLILYTTYFLSGLLIVLFNKVLKVRASGHACGIAGPVALLTFFAGPWALTGTAVLAAAWWASISMKRHSHREFAVGAVLPVAALFLSAFIVKICC